MIRQWKKRRRMKNWKNELIRHPIAIGATMEEWKFGRLVIHNSTIPIFFYRISSLSNYHIVESSNYHIVESSHTSTFPS